MATYHGPFGEIEAWQWNFSVEQEPDPVWIRDALVKLPSEFGSIAPDFYNSSEGPVIWTQSLKGCSCAYPGDYLAKGHFGDIYPISKSEFEDRFMFNK